MPRAAATVPKPRTLADLIERLDDIPADRIRFDPLPGTATEADVLRVRDQEKILCELVDGTLVEKAMGYDEGQVTFQLIVFLGNFLRRSNLGLANGPDGTLRLTSGLLRIPDVSFVSWDRLPGRKKPAGPIPTLALDLAVEVLSASNSKREMKRKVGEYFASGVRMVWLIDFHKRTARVYTSPKEWEELGEGDALDGGDALPGFRLPLRDLFDAADRGPDA